MVGIAAFAPGDTGSNPSWFAVSKNSVFMNNKSNVWYFSNYCNPGMGGILVGGNK